MFCSLSKQIIGDQNIRQLSFLRQIYGLILYSFRNGRENGYTKVTFNTVTDTQRKKWKKWFQRLTFYQKILSRSFWKQFWCWTWRKLDPWKVNLHLLGCFFEKLVSSIYQVDRRPPKWFHPLGEQGAWVMTMLLIILLVIQPHQYELTPTSPRICLISTEN